MNAMSMTVDDHVANLKRSLALLVAIILIPFVCQPILSMMIDAADICRICRRFWGPGKAKLSLPFITADASGPKHIEETLSRAKFEQLASKLITRCRHFGARFQLFDRQTKHQMNHAKGQCYVNV